VSQAWARAVGAINGAVGDYLARTNNPLATTATLARAGRRLSVERGALAAEYPSASPTIVVLLHGLMGSELDFAGARAPDASADAPDDYGALLERDLQASAVYVRYNSGLRLAESARAASSLLSSLIDAWPVAPGRIVLIGHSMGALVARGACHHAREQGAPWVARVTNAIYLGGPHQGAPLERAVAWASRWLAVVPEPTTRLVADVASVRSEGIRDLGQPELPGPLDPAIRHLFVASTLAKAPLVSDLLGDVLVPVPSALDGARGAVRAPHVEVKLFDGISHLGLAHSQAVYDTLKNFLTEASP
jgi:triacylglycerol lipase